MKSQNMVERPRRPRPVTRTMIVFFRSNFEALSPDTVTNANFSRKLSKEWIKTIKKRPIRNKYTPRLLFSELFNIPDWECPDALKAPFYEGLEGNDLFMSPILLWEFDFWEGKLRALILECPLSPTFQKLVMNSWC